MGGDGLHEDPGGYGERRHTRLLLMAAEYVLILVYVPCDLVCFLVPISD